MLLVEGGVAGAQDFLKLMGQLISRFGTAIQAHLQLLLTPITRRVFDYVASGEKELARQAAQSGGAVQRSELGREVRDLRTSYYGFLGVLVRNADLARVMCAPENGALLEAVLGALKQGTLWWGYPNEQRDCWNILHRMLELWGANSVLFRKWFVREMFPVLLQSPCLEVFPFEQADYLCVERSMCVLQRECVRVLPDEFGPMLMAHLSSMQCDDAIRQQYMGLLRGEDREPFIDWYVSLLSRWRKKNLYK
jgi:hypothetical protein